MPEDGEFFPVKGMILGFPAFPVQWTGTGGPRTNILLVQLTPPSPKQECGLVPANGTHVTESELLERCRNADHVAQRQLYEQTSARIYRLLLKMTRSEDAASDLSQDTYVRAFTRIAQFNGESSLATWLYRIAVNEALQFLRRKAPVQLDVHFDNSFPTSDFSHGRVVAALDLDKALEQLDPLDRAILLLRYQEGLDYSAIAAAMDCPTGTVASRLNRARQRIRELLANGYDPAEEIERGTHQIERETSERLASTPGNVPRAEPGMS